MVVVIPVQLQPEPPNFHSDVREKGHDWLNSNGIPLNAPPPKGTKLPSYWSTTNVQLWESYSRTCAYLAIYYEFTTGASSTDHFIAKSKHAGQAYEWNNYRLSCLGPNRNKKNFADVLDPIGLPAETFHLNFLNGEIFPNSALLAPALKAARKTIRRLGLDSHLNRKMRTEHFDEYLLGDVSERHLMRHSPFVWFEARRQNLL